jgi:hypothetical protein
LAVVNIRNENISVLINRETPEFILQKILSFGSEEKEWPKEKAEMIDSIIKSIMYFSMLMNGSCS